MTEQHIDRIVLLIQEAVKEKHGTMLLVTKAAKQESKRLCSQAIPIKPKVLTPELLRTLTPIDGAVILNPKGVCYALGGILDGIASAAGTPARGARYNSALRYVETSRYPCLAIVISEDGGADFIPDLRPAVKQSDINMAIEALKKLAISVRVDRRRFNKIMEWLDKHRFYLLPNHCSDINEMKTTINAKIMATEPSSFSIIRNDFVSNPEMNVDLYYEPES